MAKQAEKSKKKTVLEAKITAPEGQETPSEVDTGTLEVPEAPQEADTGETPETPPEAEETQKRYIFPRQGDIKCPDCGLYETVAVSTRNGIQIRKCTRAIPRCYYTDHTFKISGTEVKITDCKQGG